MASVRLDFVPPAFPGLVELKIYEAAAKDGTFSEIEAVSAIGTYPNYISTYTTTSADDINDWFAIDWTDSKGATLGMSDPIKGNSQLLLGEIVGRVMVRDASINENIIYDEAQAVLEMFLPAGTDIEDAPIDVANYQERSGLTLLTMARCYIFDTSEGTEEYTVGLVSQKKGNSRSMDGIKELLRAAQSQLGLSYSVIMQMAGPNIAGGGGILNSATEDKTRLLIELQ